MSADAAAILNRMRTQARSLRNIALQSPDITQSYVNTGVSAEISLLSASSLVPGAGTGYTTATKEEYENFITTLQQIQNFWNSLAVTSANNASFTQNILNGG